MSDDNKFSWDQIINNAGTPPIESDGKGDDLHDILNQIKDRKDGDEPPAQVGEMLEVQEALEPEVAQPAEPVFIAEEPVPEAPAIKFEEPPVAEMPPVSAPIEVPMPPIFEEAHVESAEEGLYSAADLNGGAEEVAGPKIDLMFNKLGKEEEVVEPYKDFGKGLQDDPMALSDNGPGNHIVAVPSDLIEPEEPKGKYFVDEDLQEQGFVRTGEDVLPVAHLHLDEVLRTAFERKASDIHITAGLPPMMRVDGEIIPLPYEMLTPVDTQRIIYECLTDEQLEKFENTHELDFGYAVKGVARFRFNVYQQRTSVAGALRMIPNRIPSFDELRLPPITREICKRTSGLILVTGPTGSGKSTTIAAMLDDVNESLAGHIMTIEDPIEYLHKHKRCMVNQRELHSDTYSLHNSLRAVLREDPDVILVGELRDLETIEAALTLAETGHLVFGTLHTRNAPSSIDRIVDVFPSDQQDQIRVLLANTIEGIVSQQLLPMLGGGRIAALEVMTGIPAIKNLIREGKTHQMYSIIETNKNVGMQTMDSCLAEIFRNGYVSYDECIIRAVDKETFARLAERGAA